MYEDRILSAELRRRVMSADEAAQLIKPGSTLGASGFTGTGYPKAVPMAIARAGIGGLTLVCGASTGDELDGTLARAGLVARRYPFQSNPDLRKSINSGGVMYRDIHLGHMHRDVRAGILGKIDTAIIECCLIEADGSFVPTMSVGISDALAECAESVILELCLARPAGLKGMHDITPDASGINSPSDRAGRDTVKCDIGKIAGIVVSDIPDRPPVFTEPDATSEAIAQKIIEILDSEKRRTGAKKLVLQSGVGVVANAVLEGLSGYEKDSFDMYTEVIQDGALDLIRKGVISSASATSLSLSRECINGFLKDLDFYKKRVVLRPQCISNGGAAMSRLSVIAMNTAVEADIYGNINSTHVMGSRIINGIGGSADFSRDAALTIFMTPSTAKNGAISCIVPMVTHVDSTEHDVHIIVTEQGYADLRGLAPKERARLIIDNCAHPDYRGMLSDYFESACALTGSAQTPHDLGRAFFMHERYMDKGSMRE